MTDDTNINEDNNSLESEFESAFIEENSKLYINNTLNYKVLFNNLKNITIFCLSILFLLFLILYSTKDTTIGYEEYTKVLSKKEKIQAYKNAFLKWRKLDALEMHFLFNKLFFNMDYELGGEPRFKKIDCSTGIWYFFRHIGANPIMENSIAMYNRFKKSERAVKRKTIYQVQPKDLIFFKERTVNGVKIAHVGLIERVIINSDFKGVRFLEIGAKTKGIGTKVVYFKTLYKKDWWIKGIYSIGEDFWFGDLWEKNKNLCIINKYEIL